VTERAKDLFLVALLGLSMTGCATLIALDPVQEPPARYQGDVTIMVEYIAPERVALRCLERGVPFLANECTGGGLKTMPNPCAFKDQSYARIDCHGNGHANGWPADHSNPRVIPNASESPQAKALAGS
jgi:hypothetical protein